MRCVLRVACLSVVRRLLLLFVIVLCRSWLLSAVRCCLLLCVVVRWCLLLSHVVRRGRLLFADVWCLLLFVDCCCVLLRLFVVGVRSLLLLGC